MARPPAATNAKATPTLPVATCGGGAAGRGGGQLRGPHNGFLRAFWPSSVGFCPVGTPCWLTR